MRDLRKEITSFWEYGGTFDEGFSREGGLSSYASFISLEEAQRINPGSVTYTHMRAHTLSHTRFVSFIEHVVPIFPDDKQNLRDALQTSWRQHKQKSIHEA